MRDAYAGLNRLYLSMHTPGEVAGEDINDPVMAEWLAAHLPSGARVLDAGCGLGFDALAIHRGLPARRTGRTWSVYASDYSADMLADAARVGARAGVPATHYRQASFAALAGISDWHGLMDAVTVNYAIYTQPAVDTDYPAYLNDSLAGLAATLRPGGVLILNLRDWAALSASDAAGGRHGDQHTHDGVTYRYAYEWQFGPDRVHQTTLRMQEDGGAEHSTTIWFAERSPAEIEMALRAAGLKVVGQGQHGEGASAFHTLIARKELA